MIRPGVVLLIGLLLFASALSLITAQHRSRSLFIDLERSQVDAKRLDVDHERLRIDQSRLSQPAYVETEARKIGLKPIDAARTVFLNLPGAEPRSENERRVCGQRSGRARSRAKACAAMRRTASVSMRIRLLTVALPAWRSKLMLFMLFVGVCCAWPAARST